MKSKYKVHMFANSDKIGETKMASVSIRINKDSEECGEDYIVGVDLMQEAANLPQEVIVELANTIHDLVDMYSDSKELIIKPTVGSILSMGK